MSFRYNISQFISENAAIPKGSLFDIGSSSLFIRLFLKLGNSAYFILRCRRCRNNISVLRAGVGRLDTHKSKVCITLCRKVREFRQSFKVLIIYVRINGAYDNRLIKPYAADLV